MEEEKIKEMYREYLRSKWIEAEDMTISITGTSSNVVVCEIFDKITQPYYVWKRNFFLTGEK